MKSIVSLLWKLIKIYGGKLVSIAFKLLKAQLRAFLWKWGTVAFMIALTGVLAYFVSR